MIAPCANLKTHKNNMTNTNTVVTAPFGRLLKLSDTTAPLSVEKMMVKMLVAMPRVSRSAGEIQAGSPWRKRTCNVYAEINASSPRRRSCSLYRLEIPRKPRICDLD